MDLKFKHGQNLKNKNVAVDPGTIYLDRDTHELYYDDPTSTNSGHIKINGDNVDATLTIEGWSADAKKTGEEITALDERVSDLEAKPNYAVQGLQNWTTAIFEEAYNDYISGKAVTSYITGSNGAALWGTCVRAEYNRKDTDYVMEFHFYNQSGNAITSYSRATIFKDSLTVFIKNNIPIIPGNPVPGYALTGNSDGTSVSWKPSLPTYSTADNGKFLRIYEGSPAWRTVNNAEDNSF